MENIKEIFSYSNMINSLVKRELRGKYEKSILGFLWAFLGPLFQILIYTIVFAVVFHNDNKTYYLYLMSGMLPWTFFNDSIGQGTGAVIYNSEMIKKIYFPREVLVISEVNAKLINMLLSFIVMYGFVFASGKGISIQILLLPLTVLIEYIITLGFAFFAAGMTVYIRDMEYVINVILMGWIWATPVLYESQNIAPGYQKLLKLNPLTEIIDNYHSIVYYHVTPTASNFYMPLLMGIVILVLGYLFFSHAKKNFAEEL